MKLLDLIGRTPTAELQQLSPKGSVKILAKLEGNNPAGSVKDRAARAMIDAAIESGGLASGRGLVEATSGNTGIALAMMAALRKIPIELIMPDNATVERVRAMTAFGATVTLTPAALSMEGAIDEAHRRSKEDGAVLINQFANPANPQAHYATTGPEIWQETGGRVTHFVSAMGTTGTIMGCSRYLKEQNPAVTIVGVQPTDGSHIPGIRRWPEAYLPKIFDPRRVDEIVDVSEADARTTARRLAVDEGIFCGMSGGGAVRAAISLAETLAQGTIVVIIPDRGDRYLSSSLFDR